MQGVFEWGLLYKEVPGPAGVTPYSSPVAGPGGLFAIGRAWWQQLGGYDGGLEVDDIALAHILILSEVWGGENIDLSLAGWLCGGRVVWVPCSRLAHLYRGPHCTSCAPVPAPGPPPALANFHRVAETWLDQTALAWFYTRKENFINNFRTMSHVIGINNSKNR